MLPKYNETSPGVTFWQHTHYVQQIARSLTMRVIQFRAIVMFYSRSQSVFHYGKTDVSVTVISLWLVGEECDRAQAHKFVML